MRPFSSSLLAPSVSFFHQLRPAFTLFFFHIPRGEPCALGYGGGGEGGGKAPLFEGASFSGIDPCSPLPPLVKRVSRCCRFSPDNAPLLPVFAIYELIFRTKLPSSNFAPFFPWEQTDSNRDFRSTCPRLVMGKRKKTGGERIIFIR